MAGNRPNPLALTEQRIGDLDQRVRILHDHVQQLTHWEYRQTAGWHEDIDQRQLRHEVQELTEVNEELRHLLPMFNTLIDFTEKVQSDELAHKRRTDQLDRANKEIVHQVRKLIDEAKDLKQKLKIAHQKVISLQSQNRELDEEELILDKRIQGLLKQNHALDGQFRNLSRMNQILNSQATDQAKMIRETGIQTAELKGRLD